MGSSQPGEHGDDLSVDTERAPLERLRAQNRRLALLSRTAAQLLAMDDPGRVLDALFSVLRNELPLDGYFNFELDEAGDALELRACQGVPEEVRASLQRIALGRGVCGVAAEEQRPIHATHIQESSASIVELVKPLGVRAYACNPLQVGSRTIGTLSFFSRQLDSFSSDDLKFFEAVSHLAAMAKDRARLNRAAQREAERVRLAIAAAGVGYWSWDVASGRVELDPRCAELLDCDQTVQADELVAKLTPEDKQRFEAAVQSAFDSGGTYHVEVRVPMRSGGTRWLSALGNAVRDEAGRPIGITGLNIDITARKQIETALAERDRRKDEFLATLAHELRNPLAPIRTGLDLLGMSSPMSGSAGRALAMMQRQLTHMVRLIDDLLDVSRISRGKLELRKTRVELRAVIDAALETSRPSIDAGRHELEVALPERAVWLDADVTRLAQVVSNVLSNACRYTPEGGRIELAATYTEGEAVVTISDTGIGIPHDMLGRVFEMFTQVKQGQAQGGLGIGLALAKLLTEMHGGSITAQSAGAGAGSRFILRLPAAIDVSLPAEPHRGAEPAPGPPAPLPRRRVLVVDDNVDGAEMLATVLELRGQSTSIAHDGNQALSAARAFRPDVVFLDIGLPGMDGYEVARRLRAEPELATVVIAAVTGWGSAEDRRRTQQAGFDYHLTKPVDTAAVEQVLERSGATG